MGKLAYINECIKNETIPAYEVIDNPFVKNDFLEKEFSLEKSKLDIINYAEDKDSILLNETLNFGDKKNSLRKTNMLFGKNNLNSSIIKI